MDNRTRLRVNPNYLAGDKLKASMGLNLFNALLSGASVTIISLVILGPDYWVLCPPLGVFGAIFQWRVSKEADGNLVG